MYETHKLLFMFVCGQLVGVDVMAALDMYADRGQWEKCLDTASKQVRTTQPASASFKKWTFSFGANLKIRNIKKD